MWNSPAKSSDYSSKLLPILPRDNRDESHWPPIPIPPQSKGPRPPLVQDFHSHSALLISDLTVTHPSPIPFDWVSGAPKRWQQCFLQWQSFLWVFSWPPYFNQTLASLRTLPLLSFQVEIFFPSNFTQLRTKRWGIRSACSPLPPLHHCFLAFPKVVLWRISHLLLLSDTSGSLPLLPHCLPSPLPLITICKLLITTRTTCSPAWPHSS